MFNNGNMNKNLFLKNLKLSPQYVKLLTYGNMNKTLFFKNFKLAWKANSA
jgi:hypothetical protein